jgi:hypothetical protein
MTDKPDWLDALLREDARCGVADGGFTQQVLQALPARANANAWLKPVLIVASTALGSLLAALLSPLGAAIAQGLADLSRHGDMSLELSTALAMAVAVAVSGYVLLMED